MKHRVVITGMGLCTPLGCGVDEFWRNLLAGKSGISLISLFDTRSLPVRIGGEVKKFQPGKLLAEFPEAQGERDRKIWLGLAAAAHALADSGLTGDALSHAPLFVGVSLETFFLEDVTSFAHASNTLRDFVSQMLNQEPHHRLQTPLDRNAIKPFFANLTIGSAAVAAVVCHEDMLPAGAPRHRLLAGKTRR